jgi:hypothetical protein
MSARLFTDASGWILTALLGATIALPYLATRASRRRGIARLASTPLRAHVWVGYLILLLAVVHGWVPMRPDIAGQANRQGLYLATAALLVLFVQLPIGLVLRRPGGRFRLALRRCHFWAMAVLVAATLGHVALSSGAMLAR